jgi:hypothetical protein
MICPTDKVGNFFEQDWTGQIRLKDFRNLDYWRKRWERLDLYAFGDMGCTRRVWMAAPPIARPVRIDKAAV